MLRNLFLVLVLGLISSCQLFPVLDSSCKDETYAAFDIGSGSTKLLVADKNSCTHLITKIHLEDYRALAFAQDLANQKDKNQFSQQMITQADKGMKELMEIASEYEPEKILGVATQAFRQAGNAQKLIDRWNRVYQTDFRVISQLEEAKLAYLGVQKSEKIEGVVVWDIGGGSQQLSWFDHDHKFKTFESTVASVTFKNQLTQKLKRKSPNPLSSQEIVTAREVLQKMLSTFNRREIDLKMKEQPIVVGLGGVHGKSIKGQLKLKEGEWVTKAKLDQVIETRRKLSDDQIGGPFAQTEVSNLILISGLMELYQIEKYKVKQMSLAHSLILNPEF